MLYEIKGKYYILVGGKYIRVDVVPNGKDDIRLIPKMEDFIERSNNVVARQFSIDDNFKKKFTKTSKPTSEFGSRYDRLV